MDHQTLLLLFFVLAIFMVAGTPCFAFSFAEQGELRSEGAGKPQQLVQAIETIRTKRVKKSPDQFRPLNTTPNVHDGNPEGELTGSVSLTTEGQIWLTLFVDDVAILARVNMIELEDGELCYEVVVEKLERPPGTHGSVSSDVLGLLDEEARSVIFSSKEEAKSKLMLLFDALGVDLLAGTRMAIPHAIEHGWRSPRTCQQFVQKELARNKKA